MRASNLLTGVGLISMAALSVAVTGPPSTGAADEAVVVFRNANVVPMDADRVLRAHTVVVRGETIETVAPAAQVRVPKQATVIDASGQFLMPGLTDMHAHLPDSGAPPGRTEAELFLYVANGVTTARSMLGVDAHLRVRDRVRAGEIVSPTLILAGPGLNGERVKTPEEGEREVRQQDASGFDLVKILPGLSLASYDAIVRTARELRMPFGGHVPPDV